MDHEDDKRIIARQRTKYGPPSSGWVPLSMQKGSDRLPLFWIAYALIVLVVLVVIAM